MLFVATVGYIVAAIFLTIIPIIFLKQSKKERSVKTYAMQLKLYKMVLIEGWASVFLTIIPCFFMAVIYWIKLPGSAIWVQLLFALISFHGPVDLFIMG